MLIKLSRKFLFAHIIVVLIATFRFAVAADSAALSLDSQNTIDKVAEQLLAQPDFTERIITDSINSDEANAAEYLAIAAQVDPGSIPSVLVNILDQDRYLSPKVTIAAIKAAPEQVVAIIEALIIETPWQAEELTQMGLELVPEKSAAIVNTALSVAPKFEQSILDIAERIQSGEYDSIIDIRELTREERGFTAPQCPEEYSAYTIYHVEKTSRDYYYLRLPAQSCLITYKNIVGGEHMTHYRLLGFSGEQYRIGIETISGLSFYSLGGEGFDVSEQENYIDATIDRDGIWVDISLSASSFTSEYVLLVEKLGE